MNRVKEFRKKNNMSQQTLSETADVSRNVISLLETGKPVNISKKTMEKIADALNSTVKIIFFT